MFEKFFRFPLEISVDIGQSMVAKKWGLHMPLLVFREGDNRKHVKE